MRIRPSAILAWSLWSTAMAALGVDFLFSIALNVATSLTVAGDLALAVGLVPFLGVAVVLAWRRPKNPIGWMLLSAGVLVTAALLARQYAFYTIVTAPGTLPGGTVTAWAQRWPTTLGLSLMAGTSLLFPAGAPLSPRWKWLGLAMALAAGGAVVSQAFRPELSLRLDPNTVIPNPMGFRPAYLAQGPLYLTFIFLTAGSVFSLVLRYRRSVGDERQQLKWVTYGAGIGVGSLLLDFTRITGPNEFLWLGSAPLSLAIGIAILKYRLYAIDLVINRTLVYGPFTAILAGVYVAGIGVVKTLFTEFTGIGSTAAVALITLVVAAALTPLKNRLQAVVDKKFKVAKDPKAELAQLVQQTRAAAEVVDSTRKLLALAASAVDARSAAVHLGGKGGPQTTITIGELDAAPQLTLALSHNGSDSGSMTFGPRRSGAPYSDVDRQTLEDTAKVIAQIVALQAAKGPA